MRLSSSNCRNYHLSCDGPLRHSPPPQMASASLSEPGSVKLLQANSLWVRSLVPVGGHLLFRLEVPFCRRRRHLRDNTPDAPPPLLQRRRRTPRCIPRTRTKSSRRSGPSSPRCPVRALAHSTPSPGRRCSPTRTKQSRAIISGGLRKALPRPFIFFKSESAAPINSWTKDHTGGLIPEIVDDDTVTDPLTRAILVNAVYFKGDWRAAQYSHCFCVEAAPRLLCCCCCTPSGAWVVRFEAHSPSQQRARRRCLARLCRTHPSLFSPLRQGARVPEGSDPPGDLPGSLGRRAVHDDGFPGARAAALRRARRRIDGAGGAVAIAGGQELLVLPGKRFSC